MSRKRLLIIDGDETFAQEIVNVAERRGFEVLTSTSSVEGLELASSHSPDLVVVNVELSPTNGWSVCTRLKKDDALNHIPVVLTSENSTADTFEKHRKLRTRAEEYLLKPYSPADLLEVAGGLLGLPTLAEPLVEVDETFDDAGFEDVGFEDVGFEDDGFEDYVVDDEPTNVSEPVETVSFDEDGGFEQLEDEPDPLAADEDQWSSDPLGGPLTHDLADEELVAFDEDVQPLHEELPEGEALEEFSRGGEFATSEFSAGALAAHTSESSVDPLNDDFQVDAIGDEWEAEEIDPLGGFDGDGHLGDDEFVHVEEPSDETFETAELVAFEDESFDELGAVGDTNDDAGALEGLAYDEAPLEVPADTNESAEDGVFSDDLDSALDDDGFGIGGAGEFDLSGNALGGEDLARLGELEAQLDGLRAVEATREAELARLRDDLSKRDQALHELRSQLEGKDRELQETTARHEAETTRSSAEQMRRDATLKSLTTRSEQLVAVARRSERELATLRAEASRIPDLETRLSAATAQAAELEATQARLSAVQEKLEAVENAKSTVEAQLDELKTESEDLRTDLSEARRTAERALENAGTLQEKLAEANERFLAAETRLAELKQANAAARDTLLSLVEELGTA